MNLALYRAHEGIDYKRCPKKWFWRWRRGLVLKKKSFGALDLGTWVHDTLAWWYSPGGYKRAGDMVDHFWMMVEDILGVATANGAPAHVIDKGWELAALGEAMLKRYQEIYGDDPGVFVIAVEHPLEFEITDSEGKLIAIWKLKPDLIYRDKQQRVWLKEHKTATTIQTEHLVIDDQARPYGVLAERALKKAGLIEPSDRVAGVMYNFLRKALPDERETDAQGRYLNKNGTVSKKQPGAYFLRHPVTMTTQSKKVALRRIQTDVSLVTTLAKSIRAGRIDPDNLPKTPSKSCPRFCDYFAICAAEDQGADIRGMVRDLFVVQDPYEYPETADEPMGFEMG